MSINSLGFPKLIAVGKIKSMSCLVMPIYGPTLLDLIC